MNRDGSTAPLTRARIGVLMGGQSAERDVSLRTGEAVYNALLRRGYDAVTIDVGPSLYKDLLDCEVKIAFLALHGPGGEDGAIQGFLESLRIPYTGSGVRASAIGMHKEVTKTLLAVHDIPVPAGLIVTTGVPISCAKALRSGRLRLPVVVKPASQGSTIGVTIVRKPSQWSEALALAHRYDREAMVEAYIPGHEVTVGVVTRRDGGVQAFPAVEIVAPEGFYDFSAKYEKGRTQYLCPAPLSAKIARDIRDAAIRTYQILGCEGAARVDFRITPKGKAYVLEINTVPGMTETSLLPMAAAKAGVPYDELTELILASALERGKREPFRTRS
ncbi:MAG TPA: D-alanine--D-alanine ligase [Nitrospiraceae bacterium]|nr:D-alanine--D-alanine ligase [Nitrospiraceae bacterium]